MVKATWNGATLAESNQTIIIEGNHYFPSESVNQQYFQASVHHSTCAWKGVASYKTILVNGQTNENAVWFYPQPKEAAKQISGYYAFWKGVKVE